MPKDNMFSPTIFRLLHIAYRYYEEVEKELNSKTLKITMTIKDQYPELSKYLEEMPDTISDEKDQEITLKNLSSYYESLNSILKKYKSDHPKK